MVRVIYILLATAMFFWQDNYFLLGDVPFSLKNPCALGILFLALLNFIVTPKPGHTIVLARHTLIQALPCLVPLFFSSIIWVERSRKLFKPEFPLFFHVLLFCFPPYPGKHFCYIFKKSIDI